MKLPDIAGTFQQVTLDSSGMRVVKYGLFALLCAKIRRRLGLVKVADVQWFVDTYMVPNGKAVETITASDVTIANRIFEFSSEQDGIAIAPWAQRTKIIGCAFVATDAALSPFTSEVGK